MQITPSAAVLQALAASQVQGPAQPQAQAQAQARGQTRQAVQQVETLRQEPSPRSAAEGTPRTNLPRGSLLDIRV